MALVAQTVVNAVVTRLSGATAAGARVYSDHPWPFAESELPAWRIETEDEPAQTATLSGGIAEYRPRIFARGALRAVSGVDAAGNALIAAALPALFAAPVPYGLEIDGEIERVPSTEGEASVMRITLPLRAHYFAALAAPETILS